MTIGSLPDNVLLDIFESYQEMTDWEDDPEWQMLVQVCRRWRYVVFASPRRLGLRFQCQATTPVREILDVWPPVQIIVADHKPTRLGGENIIAALEHRDRVCELLLHNLTNSLLEQLATVVQDSEPFPVLLSIDLECDGQTPPVLPDTSGFWGGSAPRLQTLSLSGIPFPVPNLLLSARNLVKITLHNVPHTGYISPEAMVTCLSGLTNLKSLDLSFQSPSSRPDRGSQHPPPLTRVVLPALMFLYFSGVSEYLEDFLARINTPVIIRTEIMFFNRVIFDIPELFNFVSRTEALEPVKRAALYLDPDIATLSFHHPDSHGREDGSPDIGVRCDPFDWKISFLVQICSQLAPLLSSVERLDIWCRKDIDWQDLDHMQWLEFFRPFIAVQNLHVHHRCEVIVPALQELTGVRAMEVLPALRSLFVISVIDRDSVQQAIEPFITARRLSNQPVTIHWLRR